MGMEEKALHLSALSAVVFDTLSEQNLWKLRYRLKTWWKEDFDAIVKVKFDYYIYQI